MKITIKLIKTIRELSLLAIILSGCNTNPVKNKISGKCIADPISYQVVVNNPDIEDEWKTKTLANTEIKGLVRDVFNTVKAGRLKAYDYYDNHTLTKEEIAELEDNENIKEKIGCIQFTERWYWDRSTFEFYKKVESIMLGYEIYDDEGKVKSYKASFIIYLGEEKTDEPR